LSGNVIDTAGHGMAYIFERVEYTTKRGILLYYRGCALPKHGFPTPESILMINVCKRLIKMFLKYLNPVYAYFKFNKIADDFYRIADNLLVSTWLKEEYLCPCAKETKKLFEIILTELKMDTRLATIVANILEYDDAYRFFFQDLASCIDSKTALRFSTFIKLNKIVRERCVNFNAHRVTLFLRAIYLILLIPKIRRAVRKGLDSIDLNKIRMDECDHFWVLNRNDWKFFGQTWEERHVEWLEKNGGVEPTGFQY
jgi:hypothetical protein